jgi:hypothetical protein
MPTIAISLSLLGLLPFIAFAFGAVGDLPETSERMLISLIDYAALILSFAGGVHWGLALLPGATRQSLRFGASLLPLAVAWVGLVAAQLVAPTVAVVVLILGYLATVITEHRAARRLVVPTKYMWLRWTFSVVAVGAMLMVLVLRGIGQTIVF